MSEQLTRHGLGALASILGLTVNGVAGLGGARADGMVASSTGYVPALQDPALSVGALPNGLRYYLRVNRTPAHRVELRLAVNAGSVQEDTDQRGFAHFLEHMAFEGTRHFPHQSLVDFIETNGMRFGADLNAQTTYDETVYLLTLPTDDPATLDQGLTVLQDWASGGITIDSAAVVGQRGIVMGEWRTRLPDTAAQTVQAHYDTLLFGHSRYLTRKPIGDTALIGAAEYGPIKRFYHDWYRPDLMAVVVVGDFDKAHVESEIRRRFGAIPRPSHPRPRVTPSPPSSRDGAVDVYRGKVNPVVEVLWPRSPQPVGPVAAERQYLVSELLFQALEQRLLRLRDRPSRPFITAAVERGRLVRPLKLAGVELIAWPDSLERGLAVVLGAIEGVAQHGLPVATLARRKATLLRRLEHEAAAEAARPSRSYADAYVEHYLTGDGRLLSAAQELALARGILPEITPGVLARAARFWRDRAGERLLMALPEFSHVRPPMREDLLAILDSVGRSAQYVEVEGIAAEAPLLEGALAPGRIVEERRDSVVGITEWTLSNGARVLFKPTQNDPDAFLMRAWGAGGFSLVPDTLFFGPGRMVAKIMTDAAGLGAERHDALAERLAATGTGPLKVNITYADQSIDLSGSPRDLETLFQLLYLQFTAPNLDSAALDSWQSLAKFFGTPFSINDLFDQVFARGDPRLLPVSTSMAPLATVQSAMAVYRNRFGNAAGFTFTLVGATSPEEVRPLVERYLASLPGTGGREQPRRPNVAPFLFKIDQSQRSIPLPRAEALFVFDGPFPTAPDRFLLAQRMLGLLTTVLRERLRIRLREELSATYSPQVVAYTYALPDEHYRLLVWCDAAPRRMHELNLEVEAILDSLRSQGASAEELARAVAIQRRQLETRLQDDTFWVRAIGLYDRLGIPLDKISDPFGHRDVTPAEFQVAAQHYLPSDVYIHLTAMPTDSTLYTTPDTASAPPSRLTVVWGEGVGARRPRN